MTWPFIPVTSSWYLLARAITSDSCNWKEKPIETNFFHWGLFSKLFLPAAEVYQALSAWSQQIQLSAKDIIFEWNTTSSCGFGVIGNADIVVDQRKWWFWGWCYFLLEGGMSLCMTWWWFSLPVWYWPPSQCIAGTSPGSSHSWPLPVRTLVCIKHLTDLPHFQIYLAAPHFPFYQWKWGALMEKNAIWVCTQIVI